MKHLRFICGIVALVALIIGLNLLALKQDPFLVSVLVPLGVSLGTGLVWLVLTLVAKTRDSFREGQTLYGITTTFSTVVLLGICIVICLCVILRHSRHCKHLRLRCVLAALRACHR